MRRKEGKTDMKYASNNIRNILIAGHAGSGKTTLTEALVYFSGAAERMGRVEDGTTISDFDPEEAKRKASLSASVVPVEYEGIKYNFIDAPGLFDFEAGEYEGIRAAESVLVCVSGRSGVTVGAEKAFQLARKNGKATMVFVSKCDLENANYFKILEDMKIRFGSTICPCVVPAKLDDGTPVYINLFSQKAFKYEGGIQIQVDLPDIGHRFQGLIEAMSEAIAETDDELMEKFFGGEPFTTEEIVEGMRKGVKDGLITPLLRQCGQPAGTGYAAVQHAQAAAQPGARGVHHGRGRQRRACRAALHRIGAYRGLRLQDRGRPVRGQAELSARHQRQSHRRLGPDQCPHRRHRKDQQAPDRPRQEAGRERRHRCR